MIQISFVLIFESKDEISVIVSLFSFPVRNTIDPSVFNVKIRLFFERVNFWTTKYCEKISDIFCSVRFRRVEIRSSLEVLGSERVFSASNRQAAAGMEPPKTVIG